MRNIFKRKSQPDTQTAEEQRRAILEKEKQQATKRKEPWVAVLDTNTVSYTHLTLPTKRIV